MDGDDDDRDDDGDDDDKNYVDDGDDGAGHSWYICVCCAIDQLEKPAMKMWVR